MRCYKRVWHGLFFLFVQGCSIMQNDGIASDDKTANLCGLLGILIVGAGVFGKEAHAGMTLIGVVLLIA